MSFMFKLAESFEKAAQQPAPAPTAPAPAPAPKAGGLSSGGFLGRAGVQGRRAWRGMGMGGRNALVGALAGGLINKLRGEDFTTGALTGGLAGYGATKAGLLNTDLGTKAMQGMGMNPLGGGTGKQLPAVAQAANAASAAPAANSAPAVAQAAQAAKSGRPTNLDEYLSQRPRVRQYYEGLSPAQQENYRKNFGGVAASAGAPPVAAAAQEAAATSAPKAVQPSFADFRKRQLSEAFNTVPNNMDRPVPRDAAGNPTMGAEALKARLAAKRAAGGAPAAAPAAGGAPAVAQAAQAAAAPAPSIPGGTLISQGPAGQAFGQAVDQSTQPAIAQAAQNAQGPMYMNGYPMTGSLGSAFLGDLPMTASGPQRPRVQPIYTPGPFE